MMIRGEEAHSALAFPPFSFTPNVFLAFRVILRCEFLKRDRNANAKICYKGSFTRDNFLRKDFCEENRR